MAALATDLLRAAAAESDARGKPPELRDAIRRAHLALWAGFCEAHGLAFGDAFVPYLHAVRLCGAPPATTAALRDRIALIRRQLAEVAG